MDRQSIVESKKQTDAFLKTVDGDDLVAKEGLYHLIDLLKRTDADVVVSDYETFDDRTGPNVRTHCYVT